MRVESACGGIGNAFHDQVFSEGRDGHEIHVENAVHSCPNGKLTFYKMPMAEIRVSHEAPPSSVIIIAPVYSTRTPLT